MIESAVYQTLTSAAAIAAIVGSRVYLEQRLIGTTLPAVTFEVRSNAAVRMLAGARGLFSAEVVSVDAEALLTLLVAAFADPEHRAGDALRLASADHPDPRALLHARFTPGTARAGTR